MDNNLQNTFVPKRPIIPTDSGFRPKSHKSFFMIIAVGLFVIAILFFGGLFGYKIFLTKQNDAKKAEIEEAIKKFDPELTKNLTLLRTRLDTAKQLLSSHEAFTVFLSILQQNTVQTVRFSDLSYTSGTDNKISISMKGEANSYAVVAFQSDTFGTNENLKAVTISDLALNDKGAVTFNVKAEIYPESVAYSLTVDPALPTLPAEPVESVSLPLESLPVAGSASSSPASGGASGTSTSGTSGAGGGAISS